MNERKKSIKLESSLSLLKCLNNSKCSKINSYPYQLLRISHNKAISCKMKWLPLWIVRKIKIALFSCWKLESMRLIIKIIIILMRKGSKLSQESIIRSIAVANLPPTSLVLTYHLLWNNYRVQKSRNPTGTVWSGTTNVLD